ncbi:hypothetical protein FRACYDRAFT_236252 [Fragilariopsis cylindrus CCMP1102]|uniref:Uncharacterized protein n=1 Tax=Fragilariopsis cylindrus CCMP1102 TaxID=635003 RepID=A0A1E7FQV6_9STRA|nr:hypothetical protein FRACYDRAFT_236252 [Fragilariopsis cylindrus CCMP1102]|eukprot:OEU20183.1 hypothetical protein FRACYDRAFT_236252 [Fragilariopsis cylindrus CCMP1102]
MLNQRIENENDYHTNQIAMTTEQKYNRQQQQQQQQQQQENDEKQSTMASIISASLDDNKPSNSYNNNSNNNNNNNDGSKMDDKNHHHRQSSTSPSTTTMTMTMEKNVLSHYLTNDSGTTTTPNANVSTNNDLTFQEASKGREHVLSILKDAGIDTYDPMDVLRLPMWSSVTELYYTNNNNNRNTCGEFRQRVKYSDRFLGIAGNFNSGTTAFAITLQNNCHFLTNKDSSGGDGGEDSSDYSTTTNNDKDTVISITKDIKSVNRILNQVPWRKHKMSQYRDLYIKNNNNHPTIENTIIKGENVLPIVLIRDPMFWMQSMCKEGYGVRWDHNSKYHCPNLVPNEYDKKQFKQFFRGNNNNNNNTNSSSVQVWMGPNRQVGPTWPSLIHYWNECPHKIESDSTIQQMVVADINRSDWNLDVSSVKLLPKESTDNMVAVVACVIRLGRNSICLVMISFRFSGVRQLC